MTDLPTAFTDLTGARLPIQLATMGGGVGNPELAVAVCAAGGLGMLASSHPMSIGRQMQYVEERTTAPYGVGFFAFELAGRMTDLEAASQRARVVEAFWGEPGTELVQRIHAGGALAFWQVGSREEARAAEAAGCDAVVVQGVEAGGHVRGTTPLLELLGQVMPQMSVPVVAAGGIATSDHARRAFDAGASALRVGTRLLATVESAAHERYLDALVRADAADTELTTAFEIGWPDAPHRVLKAAVAAAATADDPVAEATYDGHRWSVDRWSPQPPSTYCSGTVEAMPMYAGTGVTDIVDIRPAADVIRQLLDLPA